MSGLPCPNGNCGFDQILPLLKKPTSCGFDLSFLFKLPRLSQQLPPSSFPALWPPYLSLQILPRFLFQGARQALLPTPFGDRAGPTFCLGPQVPPKCQPPGVQGVSGMVFGGRGWGRGRGEITVPRLRINSRGRDRGKLRLPGEGVPLGTREGFPKTKTT